MLKDIILDIELEIAELGHLLKNSNDFEYKCHLDAVILGLTKAKQIVEQKILAWITAKNSL